tara:strand:+ start:300 stop:833 length:534 start_codon:yes stop_codon:yes gene_type:complete
MTTFYDYFSAKTIKTLKELCKKNKIKRYSKLRKKELVNIVYEKYIQLYDIQKLKKDKSIYENVFIGFCDAMPNNQMILDMIYKNKNTHDNLKQIVNNKNDKNNKNTISQFIDIDNYINDNDNDILCCVNIEKYKDVLNWDKLISDRSVPYKIYSYIIINYIHKLDIRIITGNIRNNI